MRHTSTKPSTKMMNKKQIQYRIYALEQGVEVNAAGESKPLSDWKRREYELQVKAWKARKGLPVYVSIELKQIPDPRNVPGETPYAPIWVRFKENGPAIRNRLRSIEPGSDPYFNRKDYREYLTAFVEIANKEIPEDRLSGDAAKMPQVMAYAENMALSELAIARY